MKLALKMILSRTANPGEFFLGALPRGLALFLGGFCLLNLLGALCVAHFDATLWWIDLYPVAPIAAKPLLMVAALFLVAFGARLPRSTWRRSLTGGLVGVLALAALANSVRFYVLLGRHSIRAGIPPPLSLVVAAAPMIVFAVTLRAHQPRLNSWHVVPVGVVV